MERQRTISTIWWVFAIGIVVLSGVFTIWYRQRFPDAVAVVFGSVVGTMVGITTGLRYERLRHAAQAADERDRQEAERRQRLELTEGRVRDELIHNGTGVLQLQAALRDKRRARADLWAFARTIADSFESMAYRELESLARLPIERHRHEPIALVYQNLIRLRHRVSQAEAEHTWLLRRAAHKASANRRLRSIRASLPIIHLQITQALESVPAGEAAGGRAA